MDINEALSILGLPATFSKAELDSAFNKLSIDAKKQGNSQQIAVLLRARNLAVKSDRVVADAEMPAHSREPKLALEYLSSTSKNVFVTGPGGTGKSHLLINLYNALKHRKVAVVAPTGTAAMRLDVPASTAHSFFKLGIEAGQSFADQTKMRPVEKMRFKVLDVLIFDEISMVNADFLDAINLKLQAARGNPKPFGGIQVFMFGDPLQLPPVPSTGNPLMEAKLAEKYPAGIWFFESEVYEDAGFEVLELRVNHRIKEADSSGAELIEMLRKLRRGDTSAATIDYFNQRLAKSVPGTSYITLVAENSQAIPINETNMDKILGETYEFKGTFEKAHPGSTMEPDWSKAVPEEILKVKVGAQVMFIKNDDQGGKLVDGRKVPRWANGHEGIVEKVDVQARTISVRHKQSGETYEVKMSAWEVPIHEARTKKLPNGANVETLEPVVQARYIQFPLKLAWALTIHKSQGQTYDNIMLEPKNIRNEGQAYVALSRATSYQGISLLSELKPEHIKVSVEAMIFMKNTNPIHF